MNLKLMWGLLLAGFIGVNIYAFSSAGVGDFQVYLSNLGPWGTLATVDLVLALLIGIFWMWSDAKSRNINPLPYVVLTLLTGSIGLLLYLVRFAPIRQTDKPVPAE